MTKAVTRSTKVSRRIAAEARKKTKATRNAALASICRDMASAAQSNDGKVPYGYVTNVTEEWPCFTPNVINKAYIKFRKTEEDSEADTAITSLVLSATKSHEMSDLSESEATSK